MRTAEVCPECPTYTNALCIIYDGAYLVNIQVSTLDSLAAALETIDGRVLVLSGMTFPEYADNAAAVIGGLAIGNFYRTGDFFKIVH